MDTASPTDSPPPVRREIKEAVQDLLRHGFIGSDQKPSLFAMASRCSSEINMALAPLDLMVRLDELRGIAILCIAEEAAATSDGAWGHPLVRRQRMTLEQSLLVAILRQYYVVQEQESGIGVREVKLAIEDLLPTLTNFLGDTGSDARNEQRLLTLLDQLKPHGIVSEPDKHREVTIRPLITHLANPETLTTLLAQFRQLSAVE